jgi:hypothetical protein
MVIEEISLIKGLRIYYVLLNVPRTGLEPFSLIFLYFAFQ